MVISPDSVSKYSESPLSFESLAIDEHQKAQRGTGASFPNPRITFSTVIMAPCLKAYNGSQ